MALVLASRVQLDSRLEVLLTPTPRRVSRSSSLRKSTTKARNYLHRASGSRQRSFIDTLANLAAFVMVATVDSRDLTNVMTDNDGIYCAYWHGEFGGNKALALHCIATWDSWIGLSICFGIAT